MAEPLGIFPIKTKQQQEEEARQRIRNNAQAVSQGISAAGGAIQQAATSVAAPVRAAARIAAGTTFDKSLPDYSTPGYAPGLLKPTPQQKAQSFVAANPQQALAGQQMADEVSYRAVRAGIDPVRATSTQSVMPGKPEPQGTPAAIKAINGEPQTQGDPNAPKDTAGLPGWQKTGIGAGAQGGEIVGRRNEQGVAEFTNDPAAQKSATGNFGISGKGRFSVMPSQGVAGVIADQNQVSAADMMRAQSPAVQASGGQAGIYVQQRPQYPSEIQQQSGQQGQGIRVINAGDPIRDMLTSSDPMQRRAGIAMQRERMAGAELDQRAKSDQARIGIDQQRLQQEGQLGNARLGIQQQELGITGRKAEQDIAASQFEMDQKRHIASLQQQYADPNASEEDRQRIATQLWAFNQQSARDRYITVSGGKVVDQNGMLVDQPGRLYDTKTQRYVDDAQASESQPAAQRKAPAVGEVRSGYRFKGGNPADQNSWEKV